ncbi:hypothetical protein TNCV_2299233 [Trichonephila clavipes]|nr:hypothetical protein TNCV_2299233 [Trichonephila clavipes]
MIRQVGNDELKLKFAQFGYIEHVNIRQGERLSGKEFFRYGFVTFRTEDDALKAVENGNLTAQRYADEILRPHVLLYTAVIGGSFL